MNEKQLSNEAIHHQSSTTASDLLQPTDESIHESQQSQKRFNLRERKQTVFEKKFGEFLYFNQDDEIIGKDLIKDQELVVGMKLFIT